MERRHYRNPPIAEATCELKFVPGPEWDEAFYFALLQRLRSEYGGKVRRQQVVEAGLLSGSEQTQPTMTMKQGQSRWQYPSEDGTRIVAVGENDLSVHVLRPYERWETFRDRIVRALEVYRDVANPAGVNLLSLRYINTIQLPPGGAELSDYFTAPPRLPDGVDVNLVSVLSRIESVYKDSPVRLVSTFATLPQVAPGTLSFLLDTDLIREWPETPLPLDGVLPAADNLKSRQTDAFESMITDKTRELFDAVSS